MGVFYYLFFIKRQTVHDQEEYLCPKTHSFNPDIERQLDPDERGRCEGKIHTNLIPLELKLRQHTRKDLLHNQCNTMKIRNKWNSVDRIPLSELNNLLVDDRHGIIYCYVPKVGCTVLKRIMIVLSESLKVYGVPYRNPNDIPIEDVHGSSLQHLNKYPKKVMTEKLKTYKKFIFVRDPFVRLISAYRDKIQNPNQNYYETIGMKILSKFRNVSNPPGSAKEANAAGIIPSFYNFIEYIISLPFPDDADIDEHWRETFQMCHPCLINYDFIGKMETMEEDVAHLLRMLHVDNLVSFKAWTITAETSWIKKWYSDISKERRRKLYEIYEADFRLFGYEDHENV
ncbi:carbohydrate sulfotransferase 12-like [Clarias gariepinus]